MTRFVADVVVTCDGQGRVLSPGAVEVEGGAITWVGAPGDSGATGGGPGRGPEGAPALGPTLRPEGYHGEVVRLEGALLPGLVNTHCHSPMTLLRGAGGGLPLSRWLSEAIWPREARLEGEDVYWGMTLACAEMLGNGVTSSCEMYFYPEETADAVEAAGMRCMVTPGIILAPAFESLGSWQEQLDRVTMFYEGRHGSAGGRVTVGFAAHAAYTLPLEAFSAVAGRAAEMGALFHTHLSETRGEASALEERFGMSVPRLLADRGAFAGDVLAAHCVWVSDDDISILADHEVAVAHCPQSNAKLGSGIARLSSLVSAGVTVALGTDGPASNDNLDLWEEMRLAVLLASVDPGRSGDGASPFSPQEALDLATRKGAEALRIPAVGSLEAGRRADMVLVDLDAPAFTPVTGPEDLLNHLVWSGDSRSVTDVWVDGVQVVRDRVCISIDVAEARRQVQSRAERLL